MRTTNDSQGKPEPFHCPLLPPRARSHVDMSSMHAIYHGTTLVQLYMHLYLCSLSQMLSRSLSLPVAKGFDLVLIE